MSAELTEYELRMLELLRRRNPAEQLPDKIATTIGQKLADRITSLVGSWTFIVSQSVILVIWIAVNIIAVKEQWDPYPFILLNLVLSFQAAYTAPVIMMSQNREAANDRARLQYYYEVNIKSELEIELLHQKVDDLMQMLIQPVGERTLPETAGA